MRVEPIEKLLPETLAQAREICGLTQEAFALAVGVSRSFVALVETERKPIPPDRLGFRAGE